MGWLVGWTVGGFFAFIRVPFIYHFSFPLSPYLVGFSSYDRYARPIVCALLGV